MLNKRNKSEKPLATILSCAGLELTDFEKRIFERSNPLGVTLFARNIQSKAQVTKLIKEIKEAIGRDNVLICLDQEGGRVRRLTGDDFHHTTSILTLGQIQDIEQARKALELHARITSYDLETIGANVNFAPVLDLLYKETTKALGNRCLCSDKSKVMEYGKILRDTHIKHSICPCIKHMPGHGRASVDPHLSLPILDVSLKELRKTDFVPFKHLSDSPMGMTAHIVIPEIDNKNPITISKKGIEKIIRGELSFDGLLVSDAINMKALKGTAGEKTKAVLAAGCDVVCYCFGDEDELTDVIANSSPLTDEAYYRFQKVENIIKKNPKKINIDKGLKEYNNIIGNVEIYTSDYDATEILHNMKK